jgi:hypothetical protein
MHTLCVESTSSQHCTAQCGVAADEHWSCMLFGRVLHACAGYFMRCTVCLKTCLGAKATIQSSHAHSLWPGWGRLGGWIGFRLSLCSGAAWRFLLPAQNRHGPDATGVRYFRSAPFQAWKLACGASQFPLLVCYATAHACALQTQVKALSFPVGWDLEHSAISRHRAARNGGTQSLSWGLWMSHYALPLLHGYCRDRAHWWLRQVHVFLNYLM